MPSHAADRDAPPFIRWTLITFAIALGCVYAFGPDVWSSSRSLTVLKSISWFPIRAWGFVFIFAGMLMLVTKLWGHALAMIVWGTWWMGLVATAFTGDLTGGGGLVWPLLFLAINGYEVYRWGQKRMLKVRKSHRTSFRWRQRGRVGG